MFARASKFCKTINRENAFLAFCVIFTIIAAVYSLYVGHAFGEVDPKLQACIDKATASNHTMAAKISAIKSCYPVAKTIPKPIESKTTSSLIHASSFGIVGIEITDNCITAFEHNVTTDCIDYSPVIKYDNTNKQISGGFIKDHGYVHREKTHVQNDWKFWNDGKNPYIVAVDPTPDAVQNSPMHLIILEPKSFQFVDGDTSTNHLTWQLFQDRYVESDCSVARIKFNDTLLVDTINYMLSGCKNTSFNNTQIIKVPDPVLDWKHGLAYSNWLKQAKQSSIQNCITKKCDSAPVAQHYQGYGN